jgi:hypothetical protein
LTTHGKDNTRRALKLVDVQNGLEADVLEVKAVRFIVVCEMSATAIERRERVDISIPVLTVSGL